MPFAVSPGVEFTEKDYSVIVPGVNTSIGCHVGQLAWGPVDKIIDLSSEEDLVNAFGEPKEDTYVPFFVAADFLSKSNHLKMMRVCGEDAANSTVGGDGVDLTLDTTVLNGQVQSVVLNVPGTGYVVGDLIEIDGGLSLALLRVINVSNDVGAVTGLQLLSNGTGYGSDTDVATIITTNTQIKNYDDFEQTPNLPEVFARYPGAIGDSLQFSIVRASEFDNWKWKYRFITPPDATVTKYDGTGEETSFDITTDMFVNPSVVTVDGLTIENGTDPGQYQVTGTQMIFNTDDETFAGDGATNTYTLLNSFGVSTNDSSVVTIDGTSVTQYSGVGDIPQGQVKVTSDEVNFGVNIFEVSGDSVTTTFNIIDVIGITDGQVWVDGVAKTVVAIAPAVGEVQVVDNGSNTDITFHATEAPGIGAKNIRVEWGYPANAAVIIVTYGYPPLGSSNVKVFSDQTECHAVTVDQDGLFTGEEKVILERFQFLSFTEGAVDYDGTSKYYIEAINRQSKFVRIGSTILNFGDKVLTGGVDDNVRGDSSGITSGIIQTGWANFRDSEYVEISHVIAGDANAETFSYLIGNVSEYRRDCVVYGSPRMNDVVNNRLYEKESILEYRDLFASSSYAHLDDNWKQVYDRYNKKFRWIPGNGEVAGLYAQTHIRNDPWISSAGFNRGRMTNTLKLAWNSGKPHRDELYPAGVNSLVHFRNEGAAILYGDKTMQTKPSAFDHMDVRWLFITLEKQISKASKYYLFEKNTQFTRNRFVNMVNPLLRDAQGREGIEKFVVVCDERNNPESVRARHEFVGDIFIKPTYSINFIQLNFNAVGPNVTFDEIINALLPSA